MSKLLNQSITSAESEKLHKAFETSEFQTLFADYISNLNDPKFRDEQDRYLELLEEQNELPKGKALLHPCAGFVLKFRHHKVHSMDRSVDAQSNKENSKSTLDKPITTTSVFANAVYSDSDMIEPPTKKCDTKGSWLIPHMTGPLRMEPKHSKIPFDSSNSNHEDQSLIPTVDVCFHSQALVLCSQNPQFLCMLADIVRDQVLMRLQSTDGKEGSNIELSKAFRVLKGVQYKCGNKPHPLMYDISSFQTIQKMAKAPIPIQDEWLKMNKGQDESMKKTVDSSCIITNSYSNLSEVITPKYSMKQQTKVDLTASCSLDKLHSPHQVIVTIYLPGIESSEWVEVDVVDNILTLLTKKSAPCIIQYHLRLEIPYPIRSCDSVAKFHTYDHKLVVTAPIIQSDQPKGCDVNRCI